MSKHTPILIPQILGYGATPDGEIWSLTSNWRGYGPRPLRQVMNGKGYLKVRLKIGERRRNLAVHKLIAATFLSIKPSPAHEVCHKNGNSRDNRVENLTWGTRRDNAADRERHGRTSRGQSHSAAIKAGLRRCV